MKHYRVTGRYLTDADLNLILDELSDIKMSLSEIKDLLDKIERRTNE